jgi:glutaredoxin
MNLYTGSNCRGCSKIKEYLKENEIEFNELSSSNPQNRKKMLSNRVLSVPAAELEGSWYIGYDEIVKAIEA